MSKYVDCPECEGKKVMVYSCCTGDPVFNESMICPTCKEHLGEEDCNTCGGSGRVLDEELPEEYHGDDHDCFEPDRGGTGHGDISHSDADPGL